MLRRNCMFVIWRKEADSWHVLCWELIRSFHYKDQYKFSKRKCGWMADISLRKDEERSAKRDKGLLWRLYQDRKDLVLAESLRHEHPDSRNDKLDQQDRRKHHGKWTNCMCECYSKTTEGNCRANQVNWSEANPHHHFIISHSPFSP